MVKLDLFTHYPLDGANTLGVPARAGNYVKVSSCDELKEALKVAQELKLKVLILGGGSNLLLPDVFVGLVIHIDIKGIEVVGEDDTHVFLRVGAGVVWQDLVEHCLNFHYWGLENLSLIPGTVGAAPIQNIGAYGVELQSVFYELNAVQIQSRIDVTFDNDGCEFSYRNSAFKGRLKDQFVISSVTFKLFKTPHLVLHYPALQQALARYPEAEITPDIVSRCVCEVRRSKLPDPSDIPNVGSFFKNPIIAKQKAEDLQKSFADLATFPVDADTVKVAAAWLLDKAGWKGFLDDGLGFYSEQALVLINPGRHSSKEVLALAKRVQEDVKLKFDIELEREPISYC